MKQMKQYTITFKYALPNRRITTGFRIIEAETLLDAIAAIKADYDSALIMTVRDNTTPLRTIVAVE